MEKKINKLKLTFMKQSLLKKLWLRTSLLVAVILCGATAAWGQDVIEIGTVDELKAFRDAVNNKISYAGKTVKLTADLDLSGEDWFPIGYNTMSSYPGTAFKGNFDGGGHTISNLKVSSNEPNYATAGFFGSISAGSIKNLTLKNVNITSTHWAGGIVAYKGDNTKVTIDNCHVKNGSIVSTPELINGSYDNGDKVGGIMGQAQPETTISNCSVENLTIKAYRDLGGIVGWSASVVTNNTVKNVTVTQDLTNGYKNPTPTTVGDIVGGGSAASNPEANGNTVIKSDPVAQIGETKYETLADAVAAANTGDVIEIIKAGDYKLPNLPNNVTIEGTVEGVNIDANVAYDSSIASVPNGATFKDLTFNWNDVHYHGFQHAGTINMENCKHNGRFFSYGNMNFTNCEFEYNGDEYCMWVYGSGEVVYDNCTFTNNTKGKLLHLYCEDTALTHKVTVKDCKFHNNGSLSKSAINVKATSSNGALQYDLYLEGNNTVEGNFPTAVGEQDNADHTWILSPIVQVDDRKISPDKITVYQDGKKIYPIQISTPTIFHDSGVYEGSLDVAIAGEGTIMYKLGTDGAATAYTAPFTISETTTVTAWAEKDGVKSDEVSREFTIEPKQAGADVADGYYNIKTSDGKYVNVAGRKTVTLASDAKSAGTVIRVSADANGVKVLRSQGVDVPGYAKKAMNYVPEIVQLAVDKLHAEGSGAILGEHGLDAIMEEFNKSFDYNLYLEKSGDAYRIYGRTPSMKPVVDFYAKNKANVDAKLPMLEDFINSAIDKVLAKTGNRGASILVDFKLHDVWQKMSGTLTEPTDEASTLKFYEEVLSSETNVWNFAYQTAMIYWGNLKNHPRFAEIKDKLGDYSKYIDKVENIRPNFKYYIVPSGSGVDFISEGNEAIINNNASAAWTIAPVTTFQIEIPNEKTVTVYPTSGGTQTTYKEYYTTLYTDFAYTLPEGVKAYKVTAIDEKTGVAKREEITGSIPAQTPVLLVGKSNEATLTLSTEAGTAITDNLLVGPDALINEYQIQTPQVVSLFEFAMSILGESAYDTYVKKYEHLMLKNAGTVNNKYFFGLTEEDVNKCVYDTEDGEDCVVRGLDVSEGVVAFHDNWKVSANSAFLVSEEFSPVKLFLVGDVNRDGIVSIADVTALVNIILGKAKYPADNDKYDFEAANVNGDEIISIADVTALVNIILGK